MAHDGFLGPAFHELPWPLAKGALAGAEWEHDAATSSLVPSPAYAIGGAHEAVLMEQLASRLGISVPSPSSCYGMPIGCPSNKLSCLAGGGGKLSRAASSQSLLAEQTPSPLDVTMHASDGPSRKRKAPAGGKSKRKEAATTKSPEAERTRKKSKLSEDDEPKPAAGGSGKGKEHVEEPPKDYIHVRARRGQATDSHSLAERVRREKISERMKLLQDIVPGCNKATGKAVMLDEIINYVQSLQRQVELLSMKLSTVNPRLQVDVDSFVHKDPTQSCVPAPTSLPQPPAPVYSMEGSNTAFCHASSPAPAVQSPVTTNAKSFEPPSSFVSHGLQHHSLEGYQNNPNSQISSPWEDDLQSLVLMGFRGNA